jgi:hypothetical protein
MFEYFSPKYKSRVIINKKNGDPKKNCIDAIFLLWLSQCFDLTFIAKFSYINKNNYRD